MDRIADRVDLAIDFLTLGQYGLECLEPVSRVTETSARDAGCEGGGHSGCREALPPARRRGWEGFGHKPAPFPVG